MKARDVDALQEQLKALQQEYEDLLPRRLDEIGQYIDAVRTGRQDDEIAAHLYRSVHRLAGSSATFGYRAVGEIARDIEHIVKQWSPANQPPSLDDIDRVMSLASGLSTAAGSHSPGNPSLPKARPPVPWNDRERLLYLVEDDATLASELSLQLTHFGYKVECFNNATDAIEALAVHTPDALLMDMVLPEGELAGAETIQAIRQNEKSSFPAMFMSVRNDFEARLAAVRAGAQAYLVKPIDQDKLVEQLDRLTRRQEESPYRILLVDDDLALANHHALVLSGAGMITRSIERPEEALAEMADLEPDVVVLDLYMPCCSGPELAGVVRQHEQFLGIPIIYLSTETDADRQFEALRMGGDEFLNKPISDERLIDVVTTRAARARRLNSLMTEDSLTGLLKHTRIKESLENEISRQQRAGGKLVFAMLDIDLFKSINDRFGHPTGDRVIKSLANLLKNRARKGDHIGRYGGEEFALVLPNCELEDAQLLVDELRMNFSQVSHSQDDKSFSTTFSAGLAKWNGQDLAEDLIRRADEALYKAKAQGRNQIALAP